VHHVQLVHEEGQLSRSLVVVPLAWLASFLCWPAALLAQNPAVSPLKDGRSVAEPLESDRPGFADAASVLSAGTIQVESGLSVSSQSAGDAVARTFVAGSPLFRVGIGHRIELRVGGDGFTLYARRAGEALERAAGAADCSVGFKYALVTEEGWRPALTLEPSVSLPAGDRFFSSGGFDPTVGLAWTKSVGKNAALSGSLNISSLSDVRGRLAQSAVSLQFSHELGREFTGFWESYFVAPVDRNHDRVWTLDAGVSHPIGRNAQFDVSAGQQIAPLDRSWFVSVGFVIRYSALRTAHR
jgi:hypothetical protein